MKKLFIFSYILCYTFSAYSQNSDTLKFPFDKIKINFAVPDLPAFKGMGTEASNLLRPSTTEAISAIIPQFWGNGQVSLPKSLAFEVAPYFLAHQKDSLNITLADFLQSRFWQSFRLSVGTAPDSVKNEPSAMKLGLGLRFTIKDKGDLKYNTDFLIEEAKLFSAEADEVIRFKSEFLKINNKTFRDLSNDSTLNANCDKYINGKIQNSIITKHLSVLKERYKKKYWNSEKFDVAIALVTRSPDQFAANLKFNKLSVWATYALPCNDWGQLLIGGNFSKASTYSDKEKKSIDFNQKSLSGRLYVGSNNLKGFVEYQNMYNGVDKSKNNFFTLGGETTILNGIWLHFYGGYQSGDKIKQVISSLDFRFTMPEK